LRISYQSFKAENPKSCIFHPYLLKEYRNRWFLIGRRGDSDSITNFALDRIKGIKNSGKDYLPNDLIDTENYFNHLIGVTKPNEEEIQSIEIKVSAKQVPYVRTKPIHHSQEIIREYKNGDVVIKLFLICNYELRSVLLSFGDDLEVRKPQKLRQEMKLVFSEALKKYR
jgi:predicted DNA-binding transcriptional regulator YafY